MVKVQSFCLLIVQKVKEWIIAIRLERQYTKNEILAMYCNVYDFGNCGVSSAAQTYFSKNLRI
jgi:penicillin-binding protein 1A